MIVNKKNIAISLIIIFSLQPYITKSSTGKSVENRTVLFQRNYNGYALFRIPAIVKTIQGSLLAFTEGRMCGSCGDEGDINIVLKRSIDNGKTWSDIIMVWDDAGNTCGNPVPIVDEKTGNIHLIMTWNYSRVFVTTSTDDGFTWRNPREITSTVKDKSWIRYATGPVHGLQITEGVYKGRLIATAYAQVGDGGENKRFSFVIYSDDHGKTWQKGNLTQQAYVGECTIAETNKGLLLNMRSSIVKARVFAYSSDGGISWSPNQERYDLPDPRCQGSIISYKKGKKWLLYQSNAADTERKNLTIKLSSDDGRSWSEGVTVFPELSAYSDMVLLNKSTIGVLFENGEKSPYDKITFATIRKSDIK